MLDMSHTQLSPSLLFLGARKFSLHASVCVKNIKFKKIAAGKAGENSETEVALHTHTHSTIIAGNGSAKCCCCCLPLLHLLFLLVRLFLLLFELQPHLKLQQSS